jgi:hypothetical protein
MSFNDMIFGIILMNISLDGSLGGKLGLELSHEEIELGNLGFVSLDFFVVCQLFVVDFLLELCKQLLLCLVAVFQDCLHIASIALI